MTPWQFEITYMDPFQALLALQPTADTVFFDSADLRLGLGRYSYIAYSPFLTLRYQQGKSYVNNVEKAQAPLLLLQHYFAQYQLDSLPDAPHFQGGVAGFVAYDFLTQIENIGLPENSEMPELALGFYDVVIAFDQVEKKSWIFSSGFPELTLNQREQRAKQRYQDTLKKLQQVPAVLPAFSAPEIYNDVTQQQYCAMVQQAIDYILEGDVFEVCLSQRFRCDYDHRVNPLSIYQRLRTINAAPFAAYVQFDDLTLLSASPERFLHMEQRRVQSRPIKGTIQRSEDPIIDNKLAEQLLASKKDRAENAMIVDLLRNDLSKVCHDGSVEVASFAQLESYATVHHLVSCVTGQLKAECNSIDLLQATFPGGSITGAPKVRAMEIISELELNNRGPYCGNIVYLGFDGSLDSSILIRTMVLYQNQLSFQAGGAIVLDSDPNAEYQETLTKAKALRDSLLASVSV